VLQIVTSSGVTRSNRDLTMCHRTVPIMAQSVVERQHERRANKKASSSRSLAPSYAQSRGERSYGCATSSWREGERGDASSEGSPI
jgi:hypothetical protein